MERQSIRFEAKTSAEPGTFSGLAAVYGNRDLQDDVVDRGAFAETLGANGGRVPILWQHQHSEPIGLGLLEDTPAGLVMHGQLMLAVQKAREAYDLLKGGIVRGLSIGFEIVRERMEGRIRHIEEAKLWEVSLVTFPANRLATIAAVKRSVAATGDREREMRAFIQHMRETVERLRDNVGAR